MSLTRNQIATLNRARRELEDVQRSLGEEGFARGRLAEACEMANNSIFNVLSVANAFNYGSVTEDDLFPGGH
jgi:hypothetical protein